MSVTNTDPRKNGWYKSSFSKEAASCVEVCFADDMVLVRDSKYTGPAADQPIIAVPAAHWAEFLDAALDNSKASNTFGVPSTEHNDHTGTVILRDAVGTELAYTAREWQAFTAGIRASEFTTA
ncbi:DUF397 domain-containing protein [Nocardia macrotermitis]|uniref:DUF397 domain-containing protein n=1 Tax=Nocardia macrotermitis TaxID=2585198 RepID=A0A7K0DDI7_9NOCA|nr:DUF397 domain-containing protein [Nocardia macrotermitis]MQY23865.1 hypothetical protein [Nocardia macrotermitis]